MDEDRFWMNLNVRLNLEFTEMTDKHLRYFWCDGFIPGLYLVDDPKPRIMGKVWLGNRPRQAEWRFTLFMPHSAPSPGAVEWASLLPPDDVTHWLMIDQDAKLIEIDIRLAEPV